MADSMILHSSFLMSDLSRFTEASADREFGEAGQGVQGWNRVQQSGSGRRMKTEKWEKEGEKKEESKQRLKGGRQSMWLVMDTTRMN